MAWQLIYTSAPRGLLSGQSGFCTVARSAELREALVQRLEQISSYQYLRVSSVSTGGGNPTISAFRIVDIRGAKYQVLTRIQPCGLDFTARTNHLAHHLIFESPELVELPSPAAILRGWPGWLTTWQGDPRLLNDVATAELRDIARPTFPAQAWQQMTGDAGRAAGLLESDCVRGCYLVCPAGEEQQLLEMFAETLQLLDLTGQYPLRPWRHPFTTFLQAEDNPLDFQWRGCQEGTPAYRQAVQRSAPLLALRAVRVPGNSLVKIARESPKPPPTPASPTGRGSAALALRRDAQETKKPAAPSFEKLQVRGAPVQAKKQRLLNLDLWMDSSTLSRLAIFGAVLLVLVVARIWMNRHRAAPEAPPMSIVEEAAPSGPVTRTGGVAPLAQPVPTAAPMESKQLDGLWTGGPTYLILASNMGSFAVPMEQIARFQNLIRRYDRYNLLPTQIQLTIGLDRWDLSSEKPLTVHAGQGKQLSAGDDECIFDYSAWLPQSDHVQTNEPVLVRTAFGNAPHALSVRLSFSSPSDGDPFRLLVINPDNPPPPLILARSFMRADGLDPALEKRLVDIHFLGGETWRFRPFISTKGGNRATKYLYEDWPREEIPPPERELDFAGVKNRLLARDAVLMTNADYLQQKLAQWPQHVFEYPLGGRLKVTNAELHNLMDFAGNDLSARRFIQYLDRLRKERGKEFKKWPKINDDADPAILPRDFQRIYDALTDKFPNAARDLTFDNTNYFYATWSSLRDRDAVREEADRAKDEVRVEQERINSVPDGLDGTAYVGLFIGDHVEMIRFQ
jgi:hypothetical protein